MYSTRYSWRIFMKLEISRQIFEKKSHISNLIKILPVGAELFLTDRQTDGHDKGNSRFTHFCKLACKRITSSLQRFRLVLSECHSLYELTSVYSFD
jgi:hypothetical protein